MAKEVIFGLLGGIGLFIFGIKIMGESLQNIAGDRMRRLIAALTSNPIKGVAVGALVTSIIQSSSATTVMVVSFVHVGLMTLKQAVGVIMGANIGTTITAQIIAFKIGNYAMPIIGIGLIFNLLGSKKKHKYIGQGLIGFGLLFLGMDAMKDAMSFLRGREDIFLTFSHNPILGVLAGTIVTCLVQSSSATVGLTIAMVSSGVLSVDAAIPIIFGDNIGTTITAVLASIGANRHAKRAALAHVFFNVIGTVICLSVLPFYKELVAMTSSDPVRQVANAHTIFNVLNTLIFLPFINKYVKFIEFLIPRPEVIIEAGPKYLDERLFTAPPAAVDAVKRELVRMGKLSCGMLEDVKNVYIQNDRKLLEQLYQKEKVLNELTRSVLKYSSKLMQYDLPNDLTYTITNFIDIAGDIERIGDHSENLAEFYEYKVENNIPFSQRAMQEFEYMMDTVIRAVKYAIESFEKENPQLAAEVRDLEKQIDAMQKDYRRKHIERLNRGICAPEAGIIFIDILSNLERVGDHAHNIALMVMDLY